MVEPYNVCGLIPTFSGISNRDDIKKNLEHLCHLSRAAYWLTNLDIPVRLIVIPEGALQGFDDEIFDTDHRDYARACAIDIPGPETELLGQLARELNVYIMAQAKARHEEWQDLYFNVGFLLDPHGEVILRHYKNSPLLATERSVTPHDIFDWWVERYGNNLDAFWPVVETEIGCLGCMIAMEGSYPENARGLAMNGAEVVYGAGLPSPFTQGEMYDVFKRARALENSMYVVAPNIGAYYPTRSKDTPIDCGGGRSMIVDFKGAIVGKQFDTNGSSYVSGTINIEELRFHRERALVTNWLKDVRSELGQLVYKEPIYPKNSYLDQTPPTRDVYKHEVLEQQVALMKRRGIWKSYAG